MSDHINAICLNAHQALEDNSIKNPLMRYRFLKAIANKIDESRENLIELAHQETNLSHQVLYKEIDRTIFQIHTYTTFALSDDFYHSSPSSFSLKLGYVRLGVIVVFGASNFPFAYSAVGGDVVSALAVGCPVIFKGHDNHPQTWNAVCDIIKYCALQTEIPENFYQNIGNISHQESKNLVENSFVSAVSFTGSIAAGRHLFDLCNQRHKPIPFFGELGSNNPVFVCPNIFQRDHTRLANDFFEALIFRHGQVCVKPSAIIIPDTDKTEIFLKILQDKINDAHYQSMISEKIFSLYSQECEYLNHHYQSLGLAEINKGENVRPALYKISYQDWIKNHKLKQEIFGPVGLIILYQNSQEIIDIANSFSGQLTTAFFANTDDVLILDSLTDIFQKKSGRLVYNQFPNNVAVDYNMTHGGIYPATTNSQMTAVGQRATHRFVRPITYQNLNHDYHSKDYSIHHSFNFYDTPQQLCKDLTQEIAFKLSDAIIRNGHATLAVSGGRLAPEICHQLSLKKISWEFITIILVDERCIEIESSESNERIIREFLLKNFASKAVFKSLYGFDINSLNNDAEYHKPIDCIILGMGEDGHCASLFPNSKNIDDGLISDSPYSLQYAPHKPIQRISINMKKIIQSHSVFLAISGEQKIDTLKDALFLHSTYPVSFLLRKKKINIFIS